MVICIPSRAYTCCFPYFSFGFSLFTYEYNRNPQWLILLLGWKKGKENITIFPWNRIKFSTATPCRKHFSSSIILILLLTPSFDSAFFHLYIIFPCHSPVLKRWLFLSYSICPLPHQWPVSTLLPLILHILYTKLMYFKLRYFIFWAGSILAIITHI